MKKYFILLFISLLLAGCAPSKKTVKLEEVNNKSQNKEITQLLGSKAIIAAIENQAKLWKGTPYQLGGLSKKGIDCSGLVMLTFRDIFNMTLPRTTIEQVKLGQKIEKGQYRAGDLIFFKTGKNTRHVGIYYKDNQFLHASTSKGVMISSLGDAYWQKRYWTAVRVEDQTQLAKNISKGKAYL